MDIMKSIEKAVKEVEQVRKSFKQEAKVILELKGFKKKHIDLAIDFYDTLFYWYINRIEWGKFFDKLENESTMERYHNPYHEYYDENKSKMIKKHLESYRKALKAVIERADKELERIRKKYSFIQKMKENQEYQEDQEENDTSGDFGKEIDKIEKNFYKQLNKIFRENKVPKKDREDIRKLFEFLFFRYREDYTEFSLDPDWGTRELSEFLPDYGIDEEEERVIQVYNKWYKYIKPLFDETEALLNDRFDEYHG